MTRLQLDPDQRVLYPSVLRLCNVFKRVQRNNTVVVVGCGEKEVADLRVDVVERRDGMDEVKVRGFVGISVV
jgi:hypothetical protein